MATKRKAPRRCSVCGLPGHTRRSHLKPNPQNPQFFTDKQGIVHPIRAEAFWFTKREYGKPYRKEIEEKNRDLRQRHSLTAAEHQRERRDRDYGTANRAERKAEDLTRKRDALKTEIAEMPVAELTDLIRRGGKERGEINLIPFEQGRRIITKYSGYPPEKYKASTVVRGGHKFLKWEYVLDGVAQAFGYERSDDMKDDIERVQRLKDKLDEVDVDLADTRQQAREARRALAAREKKTASSKRRNPKRSPSAKRRRPTALKGKR